MNSESLIGRIVKNNLLILAYFIPGLLFFLDIALRVSLGAEILDVGADMALIGFTTYISLLFEDYKPRKKIIPTIVLFLLFFLIIWIITLAIVSSPEPILLMKLDFRVPLSWFLGLTSFIFSGVTAKEVTQNFAKG